MNLSDLEDRSYNALMARIAKYEQEAAAVLRDALNTMRARMTVIYEKYARDGKLSLADMTQYGRLTKIEGDILGTMNAATRANVREFARLRPEQYDEAFFRYGWAIDQSTGVSLKWGLLDKQVIIENLFNIDNLDNRMYKIAVTRYRQDAQLRILQALNSGLAQGKSYQLMARGLRDAVNITAYQAMRIIRTEGQTAQNAAQDAAYEQAKAQGVELQDIWDATLDGKTRDSHGAMDGEVRGLDGLFHLPDGETAPYPAWQGLSAGERISCRCRLRGNIEDYSPALRRTREDGVMPYQTYKEWILTHKK